MEKIRALAFDFSDLIIAVFNKEGIAIFCIFCVLIFAMASMAALWAFESGQFKDVEGAKFEMLED
jgi:nitrogen fixation-related uncharacterized protein